MAPNRKPSIGNSAKLFASASKQRKAQKKQEDEDEQALKTMKRPAAAVSAAEAECDENGHGDDAPVVEDEASVEEKLRQSEEEELDRRKKELKTMPAIELKELGASKGLEAGNKADMIEAILGSEAKERADKREHEAKLRGVVVRKMEELEAQSVSELNRLCAAIGVKGIMSKQERVEHLLKQWQEEDGVDKALAQMAYDARKAELEAMDKAVLQGLCEKAGVDPFVAEAMVERISKREHEMGLYLRPTLAGGRSSEDEGAKETDMVSAILANEQSRKKEKALKGQKEEAAANRKKELKGKTVEELRKALEKKGAEAAGKKDDMVEALLAIDAQEEAVNARRAELKGMSVQELKDVCASKRLEAGTKTDMVEVILADEARLRESVRAFDAKVGEVSAQKKEEFESKTNAELKELCVSKGLKMGVAKEERVERLVEEFRREGEAGRAVSAMIRKERREELSKIDKQSLLQLCDKFGADPLVKEVMVERILAHEGEAGTSVGEAAGAEPPAKKARASKK